jgi:hypothetical protein
MTKSERVVVLFTTVNMLLFVANLSHLRPVLAQGETSVLRGRGLELTDAAGRVRAQFKVEPNGEAVFRIRDASGDIRVKLSGGDDGSGLVLLDETTQPAVHIVARRTAGQAKQTTSMNLIGASGQRLKVTPE